MSRTLRAVEEQPTIQLPTFAGPIALLLTLIEQRKLAVTDVSLAAVADQYLEAVRQLPTPDPDLLAEFLAVASRLLLIKSRALLPAEAPATPEESEAVVDLERRLAEYRVVRAAAERLQRLEERCASAYPPAPRQVEDLPSPLVPLPIEELYRLARQALAAKRVPVGDAVAPVIERVPVEARMEAVERALSERERVAWEEIAGQTRDEVVATLLAVLELFKRDRLEIEQELPRGPLWIRVRVGGASVALHGVAG